MSGSLPPNVTHARILQAFLFLLDNATKFRQLKFNGNSFAIKVLFDKYVLSFSFCCVSAEASCDFESDCANQWRSSGRAGATWPWHRYQGRTPSHGTGPRLDHTRGSSQGVLGKRKTAFLSKNKRKHVHVLTMQSVIFFSVAVLHIRTQAASFIRFLFVST